MFCNVTEQVCIYLMMNLVDMDVTFAQWICVKVIEIPRINSGVDCYSLRKQILTWVLLELGNRSNGVVEKNALTTCSVKTIRVILNFCYHGTCSLKFLWEFIHSLLVKEKGLGGDPHLTQTDRCLYTVHVDTQYIIPACDSHSNTVPRLCLNLNLI